MPVAPWKDKLRLESTKIFVEVTDDAREFSQRAGEMRRMDCVDCHNRPAHRFAASPESAVDAGGIHPVLFQETPVRGHVPRDFAKEREDLCFR